MSRYTYTDEARARGETPCKTRAILDSMMTTLRERLDTTIENGITDSGFDTLERSLIVTDEMLVMWYEKHECASPTDCHTV